MKYDLLNSLQSRGYVNKCTNPEGISKILNQEQVKAYIGFDCTANSLHVGNLLQIMLLRRLQQYGHTPIILLGSATTKIGDPSGKDNSRKILTEEEIAANKESLSKIFSQFINFDSSSNKAIFVDNSDWLTELNYLDFLRNYGRHFSINRMLTYDSVKLRLERQQSLSFLEFNYMILQAYDFLELYKKYNCKLQFGGSDQWGNIINGIDLARRIVGVELFGLTSPLVTTNSGIKMGKSAHGAIWLNAEMLSPYDYWQFWRNTVDADVVRFLKIFTELPLSEIQKLAALKDQEINEAKIILANEATKLCHGSQSSISAMQTAAQTFGNAAEIKDTESDLAIFNITKEQLQHGIPIFKLFSMSGLCESANEAKRLIKGNGAKLNNVTITSENKIISTADISNGQIMLSAGKKKHIVVKIH